ncbi:uncharacterized protein KY384_000668 [Bacidia gigantensis]|uniref:uncharacterized protein n=1 Tax=Bacidia gigantensis TaxID=2732470 RepID=UPI001D054141|nr:uncharacterized protein KY384_000668 [Bacidia gigantensis]KAG8525906.1 hypothetical protein KY384_000668 [Bacidia gigantensis]
MEGRKKMQITAQLDDLVAGHVSSLFAQLPEAEGDFSAIHPPKATQAVLSLATFTPACPPKRSTTDRFQDLYPPELKEFNGENGKPIYFAVKGTVFDVSPGRSFYGPGGWYENFAGRDASRGLACGSFDEDMLTKDLQGPLDNLKGLRDDEMAALADWEAKFQEKYMVIGNLVSVGAKKS